jgi:hypothetical protein
MIKASLIVMCMLVNCGCQTLDANRDPASDLEYELGYGNYVSVRTCEKIDLEKCFKDNEGVK